VGKSPAGKREKRTCSFILVRGKANDGNVKLKVTHPGRKGLKEAEVVTGKKKYSMWMVKQKKMSENRSS